MKVAITVTGSLAERTHRASRIAGSIASRARRRMQSDLQRELESVFQSEHVRDTDPDLRRDALERAVRRIWGATL